jgi:HAD superfamily hydrolase (TIGR01484 family)
MRLDYEPTLVVASDLDGTLLTSDHRITDRTRSAVGQARAAGGVFVVVTARPVRDAAWIAESIGADLLLCAGGGVLFDPVDKKVVDTTTFPAEHATRLMAALRAEFPGIRLGVDYLHRCDLDPGFDMGKQGVSDVAGAEPVGAAAEPVVKLIAQSDSVDTDTLADLARDLFGGAGDAPIVAVSCRAFAEVLPFGVDKASLLAPLCAGPAAPAPTVAFGDMPGDLPMLLWADTSVAVANAHPAVLAVCDHVTGSNDEDGVAVFLERLLAGYLPSTG